MFTFYYARGTCSLASHIAVADTVMSGIRVKVTPVVPVQGVKAEAGRGDQDDGQRQQRG